jgi:hypothetical protein
VIVAGVGVSCVSIASFLNSPHRLEIQTTRSVGSLINGDPCATPKPYQIRKSGPFLQYSVAIGTPSRDSRHPAQSQGALGKFETLLLTAKRGSEECEFLEDGMLGNCDAQAISGWDSCLHGAESGPKRLVDRHNP